MPSLPGTAGYREYAARFIEVSQTLRFEEINTVFLDYLPASPNRILDAGSGAGQNAAALAAMGHSVVAVEPLAEFLAAARNAYSDHAISWIEDSLPKLDRLGAAPAQFDFILVDAVWHHLDAVERIEAINRFVELLPLHGRCALSLRNGPAGVGTHVFPTDADETIEQASAVGFDCVFRVDGQASVLPNKQDVSWSRIVLERTR